MIKSDQDIFKLTEEQICMLELSEKDIVSDNIITQSQLDELDLRWLKEFVKK